MAMIYKGEIQRLFPILEAIKEGKTIQYKDTGVWRDIDGDDEGFCLSTLVRETDSYRIKPKYRPFKDAEECWAEMQKHQPFGWYKDKDGDFFMVSAVSNQGLRSLQAMFENCDTFIDGFPFGVKVEE